MYFSSYLTLRAPYAIDEVATFLFTKERKQFKLRL